VSARDPGAVRAQPDRAAAPTQRASVSATGTATATASARATARAGAGAGAGVLRVCALYPDLMNIYADRGNLLVLERRCMWRGIGFEVHASGLGERVDGERHDLYYLGGGQDRDQRLCAGDLVEHKAAGLQRAAGRGAVVLGVCGGYQLLGRSYEVAPGEVLQGAGVLDARTVREPGARLIGNVAIEVRVDAGRPRRLAGFENHGGRTHLGAEAQPLGRVLAGKGNDGRSGFEGARRGTVIGTYLHGPLLPKNVWFADWLIATALGRAREELAPLDDELEQEAHRGALRAAGLRA
jgi:CobQ-like glutamine amidotransferase family enzyme